MSPWTCGSMTRCQSAKDTRLVWDISLGPWGQLCTWTSFGQRGAGGRFTTTCCWFIIQNPHIPTQRSEVTSYIQLITCVSWTLYAGLIIVFRNMNNHVCLWMTCCVCSVNRSADYADKLSGGIDTLKLFLCYIHILELFNSFSIMLTETFSLMGKRKEKSPV